MPLEPSSIKPTPKAKPPEHHNAKPRAGVWRSNSHKAEGMARNKIPAMK
jgi:hypothetical protein